MTHKIKKLVEFLNSSPNVSSRLVSVVVAFSGNGVSDSIRISRGPYVVKLARLSDVTFSTADDKEGVVELSTSALIFSFF